MKYILLIFIISYGCYLNAQETKKEKTTIDHLLIMTKAMHKKISSNFLYFYALPKLNNIKKAYPITFLNVGLIHEYVMNPILSINYSIQNIFMNEKHINLIFGGFIQNIMNYKFKF